MTRGYQPGRGRGRVGGSTSGWGRGQGSGRSRGRGRGGRNPKVDKSADELDKELETYHAEAMNTS